MQQRQICESAFVLISSPLRKKVRSVSQSIPPSPLAECCFTSTETVGLIGTGAQDGHLPLSVHWNIPQPSLALLHVAVAWPGGHATRAHRQRNSRLNKRGYHSVRHSIDRLVAMHHVHKGGVRADWINYVIIQSLNKWSYHSVSQSIDHFVAMQHVNKGSVRVDWISEVIIQSVNRSISW